MSELPRSLIQPAVLRARVDSSQNALRELPEEAFELPRAASNAFDLSANPLSPSTLHAIKRYCQAKGEHWNASIPDAQLQRINALYPSLTERDAKRIFFELPGELEEADAQISRLSAEYERLDSDLEEWVLDVPPWTNWPTPC